MIPKIDSVESLVNNESLKHVQDHISAVESLPIECIPQIDKLAHILFDSFRSGNTLFFCGNGGSASQAQHLAAEFIGRYKEDRNPLKSIALTSDTSVITCISNDYSYHQVFSRQLDGLASSGDVLIALSTSGTSPNIIDVIQKARDLNVYCALFTGGLYKDEQLADLIIKVNSSSTAIIQECHLLLGHTLCAHVESLLFKS